MSETDGGGLSWGDRRLLGSGDAGGTGGGRGRRFKLGL